MSHYTFENIKESIRKYYQQNGRLPGQRETGGIPELPSWSTLLKYLGPKSNWDRLIADLVSEPKLSQSDMDSSEETPVMTVIPKDEVSSVSADLPVESELSIDEGSSSAEAVLSLGESLSEEELPDEPLSEEDSLDESLSEEELPDEPLPEEDVLPQVDFKIGTEEPTGKDTVTSDNTSMLDNDATTIEFRLLLPGRNPILITFTI